MSWEFDGGDAPKESRDRTKLVWLGILIALVLMAGVLAISTRQTSSAQSRVYLKHIFIESNRLDPADRDRALELANDLRRRILAKETTFEDAARNYSSDASSASKGGHMGWLLRKDFAVGIAHEFAWNGPERELSPVLESNHGFHLLWVDKRELSAADQHQRELQQKVFTVAPEPQE